MHVSRLRASATAAVLTAAATAFAVSTGTASAAPVPASAQAAAPVTMPPGAHFAIPTSFRRATKTAPTGVRVVVPPTTLRPAGVGPNAATNGKVLKNTAYSTNWSGYVVTAGNYVSVLAGWTEPTANCAGTTGTTDASFWVGLDGDGSSTVEQTGTEALCENGSPHYDAWVEAYPAGSAPYSEPVEPGDQIEAFVYAPGDNFEIVVDDVTQGWYGEQNITVSTAEKASAEVITEAPSSTSGILPLTDFGTVAFSGASANAVSLSSQSPTPIDMVNTSGALKDETSALSSTNAFSDTWISQ